MRTYTTVGYVLMFNTKDQLGGYQVTRAERLRAGLICIVKCNFFRLYHLIISLQLDYMNLKLFVQKRGHVI